MTEHRPSGTQDIVIDTDVDGASPHLRGVLGVPDGAGPWPGVVMVHEVFGLGPVMRRQVERLTSAGYLVLMPDLFSDGGARRCLQATFRALMSGEGRAFADIEAAKRTLEARDDCTGRIGVLGFCMGGGFALATASRGFDAASSNYGQLPKDIDAVLAGACPVIGSYGAKDASLKGAAVTLEASLTRLGVPHDVKEYPNAGHTFMNDEGIGPAPLQVVLKRLLGVGPDPEATVDAWRRIEDFFGEHLGARAPSSAPS